MISMKSGDCDVDLKAECSVGNLPPDWAEHLQNITVGEVVGPCGTANGQFMLLLGRGPICWLRS